MKHRGMCLLVICLAITIGGAPAVADGGKKVETVLVWNNESGPTKSEVALDPTHLYRLFVDGAVNDWSAEGEPVGGEKWGVDALYCYAKWRCPTPELWRQLQVEGRGIDQFGGREGKIKYQKSHEYEVFFTGHAGVLTFTNGDGASTADNSGRWKVQIIDHGEAKYRSGLEFSQSAKSETGYTSVVLEGKLKAVFKDYDPEEGGGGRFLRTEDVRVVIDETIDLQDGSAPSDTRAVFTATGGEITWSYDSSDFLTYSVTVDLVVKKSSMSTCKTGETAKVSYSTGFDMYGVFSGCSTNPFSRPGFLGSSSGTTGYPKLIRPD